MPHPDTHLDTARRAAVHALCVAQAQDRISVDLFEQRLLLLREAPTPAAIRQILGDLDASGDFALQRLDTPLLARMETTAVAPLERMRLSAVFSGTRRSGQWTVPLLIEARIIFGDLTLDLRDAWFDADTLDIDVDAFCGKLRLILPPGTQVENEIEETMSGSKHKRSRGIAEPNGLLIRLSGQMFMSGLRITERPPTSEEAGFLAGVRDVVKRLRA
ncbi:MAG TPA: hypothetical protein VFS74_01995 [Gemmatimonadales bacterium]|jgi:hypothetical protein|nr:hypothetical protein [Gemmatimonadales bacterium]